MAVKTKKKNVKTSTTKSLPSPFNMYWEKTNYLLFGLGMCFDNIWILFYES